MTYSFTLESIVMPYLIKYQEKINVRVFYFNMYHFKDFQDSQLKDCELKPRKSLARLEPGSARPQPNRNSLNLVIKFGIHNRSIQISKFLHQSGPWHVAPNICRIYYMAKFAGSTTNQIDYILDNLWTSIYTSFCFVVMIFSKAQLVAAFLNV